MEKNKKGFSVVEILIIIVIISILASVIFSAISSSREKSRNLSTFYSMRGTADNAFSCLDSNISNSAISPMDGGLNICSYDLGAGYVSVPGYSAWPDVSKNGWDNTLRTVSLSDDGFYWCALGSSGITHPTSVGIYGSGFGGTSAGIDFCYMLKKGEKYIWCVPGGCRKEGF